MLSHFEWKVKHDHQYSLLCSAHTVHHVNPNDKVDCIIKNENLELFPGSFPWNARMSSKRVGVWPTVFLQLLRRRTALVLVRVVDDICQQIHIKFSASRMNSWQSVYLRRSLTPSPYKRAWRDECCRNEPRPPGMNPADECIRPVVNTNTQLLTIYVGEDEGQSTSGIQRPSARLCINMHS